VRASLASLILVASCLVASTAHAGNGDGVLVGNSAAMSGGAVRAVVNDGSAIWYNPAGLADSDQTSIDLSGNAVQVRAAEEPGLLSATTGDTNDGGYLEIVSIPAAATLARQLEPGLTLGLGIFAPRYEQHEVRTRLDAAAGASTSRWTLSSAQNRATYHAGAALGIRISDQLRIGVSLFGVYRDGYDSFQTAGVFALDDATTRLIARGGITRIRSFGVELGAGVTWEPHPGVLLAFTARSPGLELATQIRSTTTEVSATLTDADLDDLDFLPEDTEAIAPGIAVLTPGHFALAFAHRFRRGWIAGEIDVHPPLELDAVVRRRLVWNVRVGGQHRIDDHFNVGFGAFTDHSDGAPIAELGQTRVDFYGVTAGLEYQNRYDLGAPHEGRSLVFSTTFALRYAYGGGEVGGLLFDPARGTQRDTVSVHTTIHEMSLYIGSAVYF